jgi:hypothetical protein
VVADGEQRHAERGALDVVAGVRDRRRRHEHARPRAEQPQFGGEPLRVEVVGHRLAPGLALVGGAGVDVRQHPPDDLGITCERRHRRPGHGASITQPLPRVNEIVTRGKP